MISHHGHEVAAPTQIPRVFARLAVQDCKRPRLRRLARRSRVLCTWCAGKRLAVGDGSEGRRGGAWRWGGHVHGQLPDLGFAGEVFDGCAVEEEELERAGAHADEEEAEEAGKGEDYDEVYVARGEALILHRRYVSLIPCVVEVSFPRLWRPHMVSPNKGVEQA